MLVFAVATSGFVGERVGVVLYAPTMEQAFEATEEVLREQVLAADEPSLAGAFGEALRDLLAEGPQSYGWWVDVDGHEVWYGPVTAETADGVAPGELALLASVATHGGTAGGAPDGPRASAGAKDRLAGLRAQCRLDGPRLRAGRLEVAVHPHDDGGRVLAPRLAER
jgi:hypothetical protein